MFTLFDGFFRLPFPKNEKLNQFFRQLPWMWILVLSYLGFLLILPIAVLIRYTSQAFFFDFWKIATTAKALSAYQVTLSLALLAAAINGIFGFLIAWILVRYNFPGKSLLTPLSIFLLRFQHQLLV